jgi:hypothetical protein
MSADIEAFFVCGLAGYLCCMKFSLLLLTIFCWIAFMGCKDLPEENQNPYFSLNWDTLVQNKGVILSGDTLLLLVSSLSHTEENELQIMSGRESFDRLDYEGPGTAALPDSQNRIAFSGKNLTRFPLKQKIETSAMPGKYTFTLQVADRNKRLSQLQKFSCNILNPDFPALGIDSPVNSFFTVPQIAGSGFVLKTRGFGSRIAEMSCQWYDSLASGSLSEKLLLQPPGEPNEAVFRQFVTFPSLLNRSFKLRLGIKNKSGRAANYWLDVKR